MKKNQDKQRSDDGDEIIGRISVHPAGYGFVAAEDGSDDVFVPAKYRGEAMDGDRVRLGTWDGYKGTEGRVVNILARGRAKLTGVIEREKRGLHVTPDDPRIAADYGSITLEGGTGGGRQGQAVVVEISHYPTRARPEIRGRVLRVLGDPDDPRTEIEKILACSDIPGVFPEGALAQGERTPTEVGSGDLADRIDLRDRPFATIDPETARDFDDALCIEEGPQGGWRVWVAVADVSHYVRTDDALDREASIRGVSVYLPDRVIPMLPFPLSAGICSLNPEVDRCAMVVRLDFDSKGKQIGKGFAAAVIRSHARLDYPGVAAALQGDFRGRRERYRPWRPALMHLDDLAQKLRKRRMHRGALDLELSEAKVILDNDDPRLVRDIVRAKGSEDVKRAYQLVEEFMIAANEAVGAFFRERDLPCVWRVHAAPRPQKVEELAAVLQAYGIHLDPDEAVTPQGMKHVLAAIGDRPEARPLTFLVLRSLKQAVYQTENVGHFGLASEEYLHFTSPIRRYPDLLVHRLLKRQLHAEGQASGGGGDIPDVREGELAELSAAAFDPRAPGDGGRARGGVDVPGVHDARARQRAVRRAGLRGDQLRRLRRARRAVHRGADQARGAGRRLLRLRPDEHAPDRAPQRPHPRSGRPGRGRADQRVGAAAPGRLPAVVRRRRRQQAAGQARAPRSAARAQGRRTSQHHHPHRAPGRRQEERRDQGAAQAGKQEEALIR